MRNFLYKLFFGIVNKIERLLIKLAVKIYFKYKNDFNKAIGEKIVKNKNDVGIDFRVHGSVVITDQDKLIIGDYIRIGEGCYFHTEGGLKIGSNTQISRNVTIYTANHRTSGDGIPYDDKYDFRPVNIGKSVWVGMNVSITPGSTIGDGAIIGMGTVVSGVVPKGAVVVNQKNRVVGYRDMDKFDELDKDQKYFGKLWPEK